MSARLVLIGLDAAEGTLIDRYAADGSLPCFARLTREGASFRLSNSLETLPGAIWPEICTGISGGKLGQFYHPAQLHHGESRIRPIREDDVDPNKYFWTQASRAGCRVAVLDVPQTVEAPSLNGVHLREWGLHDRNFRISSTPRGLLEDLRTRYGDHPVQDRACDSLAESEGFEQLLNGLLDGSRRKTEVLLDVLNREKWDLFACAYGETHCAGHQLWHLSDENHPRYDPNAPLKLRRALKTVYQRIDTGISRLIEAAGPGAIILVLTSHGMGPYIGGPQLLPEVLARLGMASKPDNQLRAILRHAHNVARYLPWGAKKGLKRFLDVRLVRRAQASIGALLDPFDSPHTRAGAIKNNRCGAIRLNLRGREPYGRVEPGIEASSLIAELSAELTSLRDPDRGERIVKRVVIADEAFGPNRHPNTPDIMVVFRTDLSRLEACWSPRIGIVRVPINSPGYPRTGDHTTESRLWLVGPGIRSSGCHLTANVLDVAPTILDALDVPASSLSDGTSLLSRCEVSAYHRRHSTTSARDLQSVN